MSPGQAHRTLDITSASRPLPVTVALALHEIRHSGGTRPLLVAVLLGCLLVVCSAVLGASMQERVVAGSGVAHEGVDIVVRSEQGAAVDADSVIGGGDSMSDGDLEALAGFPGVDAAAGIVRARSALLTGDGVHSTVVESVPAEGFTWQRVGEGRLPGSGTEIALSRDTLREAGLRVGDTVVLGTAAAGQAPFTVVGALDTRGALAYQSAGYALVSQPVARAIAGLDGYNEIALRIDDSGNATTDTVIDFINSTAPVGWPQRTSEIIAATVQVYGVGVGALIALVNGFAVVAAVIALVVLASVV